MKGRGLDWELALEVLEQPCRGRSAVDSLGSQHWCDTSRGQLRWGLRGSPTWMDMDKADQRIRELEAELERLRAENARHKDRLAGQEAISDDAEGLRGLAAYEEGQ